MIGASGRVLWGGEFDVRQRYVAPTLIDDPDDDSPAMTEEIFGPLLPVKTFRHIDEAIGYVNRRDKPLALYYFGDRRGGGAGLGPDVVGRSLCQRYDRPSGQRPLAVRGRRRERVREVSRAVELRPFQPYAPGRPLVEADRPAVEIRSVPAFETVPEAVPVNGLRCVEPVLVRRENPCFASGPKTTWGNSGAYRRAYSGRSTGTADLFVGAPGERQKGGIV